MAGAKGFTPPHLIGNSEACFGVVQMSITWRLSPQLVGACTYQTPGGKIGYEGKLVQAILENSGQLLGGVTYGFRSNGEKVRGKFKIVELGGKKVPQALWKPEAPGRARRDRARQRFGEDYPRQMEFLLVQAFPRNSTLWITRPSQQIKYTSARAFANTVMPGTPSLGVPFDSDCEGSKDRHNADVRPARSEFAERPKQPPAQQAEPAAAAAAEGERTQFGHADARELGLAHRDANKPMSAPAELEEKFHAAFLDGWGAAATTRSPLRRKRSGEHDRCHAGSGGSGRKTPPRYSARSRYCEGMITRPFSVRSLADHWGCSESTVYQMVNCGELRVFRLRGKLIRIAPKKWRA